MSAMGFGSMKTAVLVSLLVLVLALAMGCGSGGLTGGDGTGNDDGTSDGTGGNDGTGGTGDSATVMGTVETVDGQPAAGVACYVVPTAAVSTILNTTTTNDQGQYTFPSVGLNQSLKVRAVDSVNQVEGQSGTFRPASDNLAVTVPMITLSTLLPPAPPFGEDDAA